MNSTTRFASVKDIRSVKLSYCSYSLSAHLSESLPAGAHSGFIHFVGLMKGVFEDYIAPDCLFMANVNFPADQFPDLVEQCADQYEWRGNDDSKYFHTLIV